MSGVVETSRRSLIRQEAIDFQQHHRQWGQVMLLQPMSTQILFWLITAAAVTIIVFLFLAHYARKETVTGYLTPTSGTAKIFAAQRGTVSALYVDEGQNVVEGQPLLSVTTSQIAANGDDVNTTMLNTLALQRESLTRQIATEEHRTASERERLTSTVAGIETELANLKAQIGYQRERIQISEKLVAHAAELAPKGFIPEVEQRRREAGVLEQKQSFNALSQQLADRQNKLTETRYSLEQLP